MSLSERARVALRMATERLSKLQDELSAVRTENTRLQEENGALRRQSDEQATEIAVLRCEMETLRAEQLQGPRVDTAMAAEEDSPPRDAEVERGEHCR